MKETTLKSRNEIREEDKWDIEKIYKSSDDFEKDFEDLKKEAPKLKDFEGKLNDPQNILEYLKYSEKMNRLAE